MKKLKSNLQWLFHDLIAHPLSGFVHFLGFTKLGNWIHDKSVPPISQDEDDYDARG